MRQCACLGDGTRGRGYDDVEEVEKDLKRMLVANWRKKAKDRDVWKRIVLQTKAHLEL